MIASPIAKCVGRPPVPHPLGAAGAAALWTPLRLPDLLGFAYASADNVMIATGASTLFNLADNSGATDFVQATGSHQPALSGGYLDFTGTQWMVSTGLFLPRFSWTLASIRKLHATTGSGYMVSSGSTIAGNNGFGVNLDGAGHINGNGKGVGAVVDGDADTSIHDVVFTCDAAGNVVCYIDGSAVSLSPSALATLKASTVGTVIGSGFDTGAAPGNGLWAGIVMMGSVITAGDLANLHAWRVSHNEWA